MNAAPPVENDELTKRVLAILADDKLPKEIRAQAFRLVDTKGTTQAALLFQDPRLVGVGNGRKGKEKAQFVVYDDNWVNRAVMGIDDDENPFLILRDKEGKLRACLGSAELLTNRGDYIKKAESSLSLFSAEGKVAWSAP